MHIYIHTQCSTCQKALRFLEAEHIRFTVKDIVKHPPSLQELQHMLAYQGGNLKKLFNTSGLLYRAMGLSEKLQEFTEAEALILLSHEGMLIKRPFLLGSDFGLTGFNPKKWSGVFVNE